MLKTVWKNAFRKNSEAKIGNFFNRENIILIILQYNIKSEIMAKSNIYHLFATALVLIRSRCRRREKKTKKKKARSSRTQMFFGIGVLKNFVHFTGKYLCQSLVLIKLQALRLAILLKRGSNTGVFL